MNGWTGNILRVNLTTKTYKKETFSDEFAKKWVGGRGFALKILWDELKAGIDPLGPENKFIVALGPIAGIPAPNTGKAVVAAKSPITGGYGDGNLGTRVTEHLRKAGYDALIVEGKAASPTYIYIEDDKVEFLPADEVWGKGTYATNDWIYAKYGKGVGVLNIGQGGENMVLYAVVRSLEGRAGGRPGMGAVMGSKKLKAIVVKGTKTIPVADPEQMKAIGTGDLKKVGAIDKETGWSIQSTTGVLAWCNEVAALPVRNFRKTQHPDAWKIDGERLNAARIATYGCPNCTMHCGITIHDHEGRESELDYENIGLLGANLEIFDLDQVASLNYLCDDYGIDTMSAGCVLSFYADAIERGATTGDFTFGDAERAKELLGMAARREGEIGNLLADGTLRMARRFGHGSEAYAMQVKGLEVAAYNCKFIPGMALAFGTSPIGAHHKESWIITFELKQTSRESYGTGEGREGHRTAEDPGRPLRVPGLLPLPVDRAGLGPQELPGLFQQGHRSRLDARRFLEGQRPDLRPDEVLLGPRDPRLGPDEGLSPDGLVRPGQCRQGRAHRREDPGARQVQRTPRPLLRHPGLGQAGNSHQEDGGIPGPRRRGRGSREIYQA